VGIFLQTNPKRHPYVVVRPLRSRCNVSPGHSRNAAVRLLVVLLLLLLLLLLLCH
jgi:hypothetical protein